MGIKGYIHVIVYKFCDTMCPATITYKLDCAKIRIETRFGNNKPELAEVSNTTFEDFSGEVGRTSEVAMFCSFVQLDKAIPLLLDMRDDLKEMKGDMKAVRKITEATLEETKGMREDIRP